MGRGIESESLAELEKIGRGLNNVVVARVVGTIGFAILKVLAGCEEKKERARTYMIDL